MYVDYHDNEHDNDRGDLADDTAADNTGVFVKFSTGILENLTMLDFICI